MKHESDRTPGKYDVLQAAKELAGYTIRLTSNEKRFPKRYRLTVTNEIQQKTIYIVECLMMAQEIYPNNRMEFERRILYQKEARAACRALMTLMEIAANAFGVETNSLANWTRMTVDVRNHTTAWIRSDIKRFASLK